MRQFHAAGYGRDGYLLLKGSAKYKASELGRGRNLTASHIRQTWEKLHPGQDKQKAEQAGATPEPTSTPRPKPSVPNEVRNTRTDLHTETETVRSQ